MTGRDAWAYNFSRTELLTNMGRLIEFYNSQVDLLDRWLKDRGASRTPAAVESFINRDPAQINWTRALKSDVRKGKRGESPTRLR